MKKIFTLLTLLLCVVANASATDEYVLGYPSPTTNTSNASYTDGTTTFTVSGKTFTVTNTQEKKQGASNFTPSGGSRHYGVKWAKNVDYTVNIPDGLFVVSVKFSGWSNDNSNTACVAKINGVDVSSETGNSFSKKVTYDEWTYNFANPQKGSFTFSTSAQEVIWNITLVCTDVANAFTDSNLITTISNATKTEATGTLYTFGDWKITPSQEKGYGNTNDYVKYSANVTYTITVPEGQTVNRIDLVGYSNMTDYDVTLSSVKLEGTEQTLPDDKVWPYSDDRPVSTKSVSLSAAAVAGNTISFTVTGNQACLIVKLYNGTPSLTMGESTQFYTATASIGTNVTLTRTLSSSYYNTICLPFDVDLTDAASPLYGAEALEFSAVDGTTLKFSAVSTMTAGTPYLVKPTANVVNPAFTGVDVKAVAPQTVTPAAGYSFVGTYTTKELATDQTQLFLGTDGKLAYPSDGSHATIKGLRAYFVVPAAAPAPMFSLDFGNGTTGIEAVKTVGHVDNTYYNLNGQRVAQPGKGLYIVNGKKVIVK